MHELSLESSEREVRWLNELIAAEASEASSSAASASAPTDFPATTSPTSGTSPTTGAEEQEETEQDEPLGRTPVSQPSAAARQEKGEPDHG